MIRPIRVIRVALFQLPRRVRLGAVLAEVGRVAIAQLPQQFVIQVIELRPDLVGHPLMVDVEAAVDVLLQPNVEVLVRPALSDRVLVVELDLRDEKPREAASILVPLVRLLELRGR